MQYLFIIIYAATLFYFTISERVKKYIFLLALQGILLFIIAFFQLIDINLLNFLFILIETVAVKSLIIPFVLNKIRKQNDIDRISQKSIPAHYSLIIILCGIIFSFLLGYSLSESEFIHTKYLSIAIAAFLTGLYFVIVQKNVFMQLIGYLIIENGVFLLSLAVGQETPFLVNIAILMDILAAVMILAIFINHIGSAFHSSSTEHLTQLKD